MNRHIRNKYMLAHTKQASHV